MRKLMAVLVAAGIALAGCSSTDSTVVDNNLTKDADNFKVLRSVVFINTRDNSYLLQVVGYCNITDQGNQVETICKTPAGYLKHFMGLQGEVVPYVVEQKEAANVSPNFYKFVIKPSVLIPNVEIR